ncbi:MAG: hypothetical protein HFE44_05685 [Oscillospiraceae bacterium]|jgi:hypothetical protein|nr:hypothetical protein [Oscillospiraceae bacterium]
MKSRKWMEAEGGWRTVEIPYRCRDCPYPSPGFICRSRDGRCMRTEVEEINERSRKRKNQARQRKGE